MKNIFGKREIIKIIIGIVLIPDEQVVNIVVVGGEE